MACKLEKLRELADEPPNAVRMWDSLRAGFWAGYNWQLGTLISRDFFKPPLAAVSALQLKRQSEVLAINCVKKYRSDLWIGIYLFASVYARLQGTLERRNRSLEFHSYIMLSGF